MATKHTQCPRDPVTGQFMADPNSPSRWSKEQKAYHHKYKVKTRLAKAISEGKIGRDRSGRFAFTDPNGKTIAALQLKSFLERILSRFDSTKRKFCAEILAETLYDMAVEEKNIAAMTEIFNRIDGRVVERHEVEQRVPVTLVFTPAVPIQTSVTEALPPPTEGLVLKEVVSDPNQGDQVHSDLREDPGRPDNHSN